MNAGPLNHCASSPHAIDMRGSTSALVEFGGLRRKPPQANEERRGFSNFDSDDFDCDSAAADWLGTPSASPRLRPNGALCSHLHPLQTPNGSLPWLTVGSFGREKEATVSDFSGPNRLHRAVGGIAAGGFASWWTSPCSVSEPKRGNFAQSDGVSWPASTGTERGPGASLSQNRGLLRGT